MDIERKGGIVISSDHPVQCPYAIVVYLTSKFPSNSDCTTNGMGLCSRETYHISSTAKRTTGVSPTS